MSNEGRIAAAATIIAEARLARKPLDVLAESQRPRDLDEAYRIQAEVHKRLAPTRIGSRVGYKIGCTTTVMQDYLGLPHPCRAGLFAGLVAASGATLAAADFGRIGIECEIAVRLGRDLPPSGMPFTAEAVQPAVAAFMAAMEVVDDRYADWRKTDAATLIADDYFAAGAVLGPAVAAEAINDAADLIGTTMINGGEAGRGQGRDVLGHPLNALAWIANSLAEAGEHLRAGEFVLTGSLVETKWLQRGDIASVTITDLGTVTLSVV